MLSLAISILSHDDFAYMKLAIAAVLLLELTIAEAIGPDVDTLDADDECSSASCALQALQLRSYTSSHVELDVRSPFFNEFWKVMATNKASEVKAFMEGHNSSVVMELLFSRQTWYDQRPALVYAAQKGSKDVVVAIIEYAKINFDKEEVQNILCTERLSARDVGMGNIDSVPAPGHHALKDAKTDAIREYILRVAGEVGGSDFQAELKGGRCERVKKEEAAKKRAKEERRKAYDQMKHVTEDTPPAEAAGIILKYYGRTGVGPFRAAEEVLMLRALNGSVLKLIVSQTGIQAFRSKDRNGRPVNLLLRAVELATDYSKHSLYAVHAVANILDFAKAAGGLDLVKELVTEPVRCPSDKIKNCSTASLARLPEVRKTLLDAADSTWAKELDAPLFPQSLGDAAAKKVLPKHLQVSGAGGVKANGNYKLVLTDDGSISWYDGHAKWVKTDDPDCGVRFYKYVWAFVISTGPRARVAYKTVGNDKIIADPTNHVWEGYVQTDKPPYPTVEAIE